MPHSNKIDTTTKQTYRRALSCIEKGRMEDAVELLRETLKLDPRHNAAWNDLGVVMEALGNPTDAMKCYRRAIALEPANIDARSNLVMLTLQLDLAQALRRQTFLSSPAY